MVTLIGAGMVWLLIDAAGKTKSRWDAIAMLTIGVLIGFKVLVG